MMLAMFREHLADELQRFPEQPGRSFESYAVTTAALTRTILKYLDIKDLTVPARYDGPYDLKTVLDRIIHFREMWPETAMSGDTKRMRIMVYSDRTRRYGERMHIEWVPYRALMRRLADDDVFVARYLLRRTGTVLTRAMKGRGLRDEAFGHEQGEYKRQMNRLALDSWDMLVRLLGADRVEIPTAPVDCFEERDDGKATAYPRFSTCRELVEGYGRDWEWTMFNPDELNIGGAEVWCMLLQERERKADGTIRGLAVPFATFVAIFKAVRGQLE